MQAKVADAKAVRDFKQAAFNQAQKEFDEANDAVFNAQYAIIQLGDAKAKELQNSLLDGSEHIEIHFSPINRKFVIYEIHGMDVPKELATCATPELVIDAVNQIKHVDELNQPQQAPIPTAKQINDSLIRAMETNLKNIQAHCLNLDINAAVDELNLYHICNNALLKKEVA